MITSEQWQVMERKLHDAVGQKLDLTKPNVHRSDHVEWWLNQGYDLDRDIIPAIKKVMVGFKHDWVVSWRLFDRDIAHYHRQRMFRKTRSTPYANSKNWNKPDPPDVPLEDRKKAVAEWFEKVRPGIVGKD